MHRHAFRENTGAIISTNLQTMKMTRLNVHHLVKHGKLMRHNFIGDHLVKVEALVEDIPSTWGLMGISTPTILLQCSSEQANVRKKKAGKNFIMNLAYSWSFGKDNNNISAYLWTSVST
jgi:primosomal protein N''